MDVLGYVLVDSSQSEHNISQMAPNIGEGDDDKVEEWRFHVDLDALREKTFSAEGYRFVSSSSFIISGADTKLHIKAQQERQCPSTLGLYLHAEGLVERTCIEGLWLGYIQPDGGVQLKSMGGSNTMLGPEGLGWPNMTPAEHCAGSSIEVILRRTPKSLTVVSELSTFE